MTTINVPILNSERTLITSPLPTDNVDIAGGYYETRQQIRQTFDGETEDVITANGAILQQSSISELVTLSTSGATTDTVGNLLPANSIIQAVVARVITAITTATDWKLGDATIAGRFSAANSTLVSGTTQVGVVHIDQTGTSGPRQTAAAKLRITTTGTPGAGQIRVTVFFLTVVPPTS